ncbi:chaplin [Streptomyces sp. NPDC053079]|uniref:chaplin n=1 Tax=Streptomyces sp. NPDC053079 TaxID=3365697 RepID=UPI0037CDE4CA
MSRIARAAVVTAAVGATLAGVAGGAVADSGAKGVAAGSPGVISGNVIQIPIHIPINLCGNTIDIVGLLNAASGNVCIND